MSPALSVHHSGVRSTAVNTVDLINGISHIGEHSPGISHIGELVPCMAYMREHSPGISYIGEHSPGLSHIRELSPGISYIGEYSPGISYIGEHSPGLSYIREQSSFSNFRNILGRAGHGLGSGPSWHVISSGPNSVHYMGLRLSILRLLWDWSVKFLRRGVFSLCHIVWDSPQVCPVVL